MNRFQVFALAVLSLLLAFDISRAGPSAVAVEGTVVDPDGAPVAAATISVDGRSLATTREGGRFAFDLQPGEVEIRVVHRGYPPLRRALVVEGAVAGLRLVLARPVAITETITVSAIRAGEEIPVSQTTLAAEAIRDRSYGQDVPALLEATPSVTSYSDSGSESNYSYFSLRGIQQTRINMTYDGVPLNDPAEHAVYFNNFHDLASAVDSIQVQRGVGTSTVGAAAFGGSVNFASAAFAESSRGDLRLVYGSHESREASIAYESGILPSGVAVSGRLSYADSDGYRDHSGSEHLTLFLNAGWQGERSSLKLISFSGTEQSQLAFLAVEPEILRADPRFNPLDPAERDRFGQDLAQLQYSRRVGREALVTASLFYNGADGWFRLWDDPVARNELLRYGIDQHFVGTTLSATRSRGGLTTTVGLQVADFRGDHTLDRSAGRAYLNTGFKTTASLFGKLELRRGPWLWYGDLQARWAEFSYEGALDLDSVAWTFVDPKVGVRRDLDPGLSLYASLGRAQREPTRIDLLSGEDDATVAHDLRAVRPEELIDVEAGVDLRTPRVVLHANLYAMEFSNEIALTGELSDIGLPLRRNVADSYRRGLEVDLRFELAPRLTLVHRANLSRNRIERWRQVYDVYDAAGAWIDSRAVTHRDVRPLLTPEAILDLGLEWAGRTASAAITGRYVGQSQLDNTGSARLVAPAYSSLDLRASRGLGRPRAGARPRLTIFVNNLLAALDRYPSGYSYPFIARGEDGTESFGGIPYVYPLAGRSVQARLELSF